MGPSVARRLLRLVLVAAPLVWAAAAAAQSGSPFGGFKHDASQPIEVAADSLEVKHSQQLAIFDGDVRVRQGDLRMQARRIEISYGGGAGPQAAIPGASGAIDRLAARGEVVITNGQEQAKGDRLDYNVETGELELTQNVMLLQGANVISGEKLIIDLATGTGRMVGRVRTIIAPSAD